MNWDLTHKDLIKKIVWNIEGKKYIMHQCESSPDTATLKEFLDQELNEQEDDETFNSCQWDTTDRAILTIFTATYEEYKETLIDAIDDLTRHSYIAKLKITITLAQAFCIKFKKCLFIILELRILSPTYNKKLIYFCQL